MSRTNKPTAVFDESANIDPTLFTLVRIAALAVQYVKGKGDQNGGLEIFRSDIEDQFR